MKFILSCSICLGEITNPVSLSCGHTYCQECINKTFQHVNECPLCRQVSLLVDTRPDEILNEIKNIYLQQGRDALLVEFPSLVMCLDCGLTPINPVVLQCQHLFCYKCIQMHLSEDLVCPACNETQLCLKLHVNSKYRDLINWYLRESQCEELHENEEPNIIKTINGMPVFFYDRMLPIKQKQEFLFLEHRYVDMIKLACAGSKHFIIVNQLENETISYGDLVQIHQMKRTQKGIYVRTQTQERVKIQQIYAYIQGQQIKYDQSQQCLWVCNAELIEDQKSTVEIDKNLSNLINAIRMLLEQMPQDYQQAFQNFWNYVKNGDQSQISLTILTSLNSNYKFLYYQTDLNIRIEYINSVFKQLEDSLTQQDTKKVNQHIQQIVMHPNMNMTQQYVLNLFNINTVMNII
ncbi:hypothetical protein pb186bvf_008537 [Paramecium bursaria]